MLNSGLGIIVGAGIIYIARSLFDLVYFKILKKPPVQGETHSMGDGDIKLLAMIGAFLGWQKVILAFFLAPFLGLILSYGVNTFSELHNWFQHRHEQKQAGNAKQDNGQRRGTQVCQKGHVAHINSCLT